MHMYTYLYYRICICLHIYMYKNWEAGVGGVCILRLSLSLSLSPSRSLESGGTQMDKWTENEQGWEQIRGSVKPVGVMTGEKGSRRRKEEA